MPSVSPYTMVPNSVTQADLSLLAQQFGQQTMQYSSRYQQAPQHSTSTYSTYACGHTIDQVRYQRQVYAQQMATIPERTVSPAHPCEMCAHWRLQPQQPDEDDEDEGFDEPESTPEQEVAVMSSKLSYRRSTDFSRTESRVYKPIRGRKGHGARTAR